MKTLRVLSRCFHFTVILALFGILALANQNAWAQKGGGQGSARRGASPRQLSQKPGSTSRSANAIGQGSNVPRKSPGNGSGLSLRKAYDLNPNDLSFRAPTQRGQMGTENGISRNNLSLNKGRSGNVTGDYLNNDTIYLFRNRSGGAKYLESEPLGIKSLEKSKIDKATPSGPATGSSLTNRRPPSITGQDQETGEIITVPNAFKSKRRK